MSTPPSAAPVLSTPATHIFEASESIPPPSPAQISDEDFAIKYEIHRTASEIKAGKWRIIALQFPDSLLPDASRVVAALQKALSQLPNPPHSPAATVLGANKPSPSPASNSSLQPHSPSTLEIDLTSLSISSSSFTSTTTHQPPTSNPTAEKLYILSDTSHAPCCPDTISAAHISAEVLIHYGRACLSPTDVLPVIYVFTHQPLDYSPLLHAFRETYPDYSTKVILMADVMYASHVKPLAEILGREGYGNVFDTEVVRDTGGRLPNRTVLGEGELGKKGEGEGQMLSTTGPGGEEESQGTEMGLKGWSLFHISQPPTALLLTLASRARSIYIYPTTTNPNALPPSSSSPPPQKPSTSSSPSSSPSKAMLTTTTTSLLRRRYSLLSSLPSVSTFGILITSLNLSTNLAAITSLQNLLRKHGKKSYLFVVGKVNPAKLANFAEIGVWVVVGCWESSLIDGEGRDGEGGEGKFWRACLVPFEVECGLEGKGSRIWGGEWWGGSEGLVNGEGGGEEGVRGDGEGKGEGEEGEREGSEVDEDGDGGWSEEESEPPEFDLRTGRYVSHSKPMGGGGLRNGTSGGRENVGKKEGTLMKRPKGDVAVIGNQISTGAEFLRTQRTWRGLGSDIEIAYDESGNETGTQIEEGRSGIARGYVNEDGHR